MMNPAVSNRGRYKRQLLATVRIAIVVTFVTFKFLSAPLLRAQSSATAWEEAAGGHSDFEVASVKRNTTGPRRGATHSNIPLGPEDTFTPTGGLFSATNVPLLQYIFFAYELTPSQVQSLTTQVPKWAMTSRYDIEAKAQGNPTKDQFRLMMQSLLVDRFKLAVHFDTKEGPIFNLVLDKPGKLGPQLQVHPANAFCPTGTNEAGRQSDAVAQGFPEACGMVTPLPSTVPGRLRGGARNVPLSMIATFLNVPQLTGIDRPVVDRTEIAGNIDFVIEFSPDLPGLNFPRDPNGPTFIEALKDQLGLKLQPATGPIESITVDHIEEPSEN